MKAINKSAEIIMDMLIKDIPRNKSILIDNTNGVFMPIIVKNIGEIEEGNLFSVNQCYEENGGVVPYPKMIFLKKDDGKYYPIYFKIINLERYSVLIKDNRISAVSAEKQQDDAIFAEKWLKSIKSEQFL